jgi:hypothetical protein
MGSDIRIPLKTGEEQGKSALDQRPSSASIRLGPARRATRSASQSRWNLAAFAFAGLVALASFLPIDRIN